MKKIAVAARCPLSVADGECNGYYSSTKCGNCLTSAEHFSRLPVKPLSVREAIEAAEDKVRSHELQNQRNLRIDIKMELMRELSSDYLGELIIQVLTNVLEAFRASEKAPAEFDEEPRYAESLSRLLTLFRLEHPYVEAAIREVSARLRRDVELIVK